MTVRAFATGRGAAALLAVLTLVLLAMTVALAVSVGEMAIPLTTTVQVLTNRLGLTHVALNRIQEGVIWDYRLSRSLVAACCGAGLALSGVILQSLLRNALAEPYVLGVSAGASTGAVLVTLLGLGAGSLGLSGGAFAGAVAAFLLVIVLSGEARGGAERTVLAGVAASQLFNALTATILSTSANAEQARSILFWLLGSFARVRWFEVQLAAIVLLAGCAAALPCARALDAFTFGEDAAASLGVRVRPLRIALFLVAALLTATMVSIAGTIGFVGLVVPHAARLLVGSRHVRLMPACLVGGALFMVLADLVSRVVIPGQVLPVGVVTGLVGVPCFCALLYRARRPA